MTEEIVKKQFINNQDMSSRQIPTKIKYRESLPLTPNSKIDYSTLVKEGLDGTEISINIEETNLSVGTIEIVSPQSEKKLVLK